MTSTTALRLVADVGGTQIRIGLAEPDGRGAVLREVQVLSSHAIGGVAEVLADYWQKQGEPPLAAACVCVAGPVDGQRSEAEAKLTNVDLHVTARSLAKALDVKAARLINDFAAVAAATPALAAAELDLHGAPLPAEAVTVTLGPGTGLGVAAWLPGGVLVAGEGGHARLAAPDAAAEPLWAELTRQHDFIAAEHVLCGRGLVRLHAALARLHGSTVSLTDAAAVWQAFLDGDALAVEAVSHFTGALGAYAGDLALIFGARSVLLAGGILPRWGQHFDKARFRRCFAAKEPDYQARLAGIPSATILHPYPGLLGLGCMPIGD